ncbi:hypothetical protein [Vibrio coralliilyticus]|uniref:Uncharacterized protein n=1 Tax=Vibrio coralliilyticus TaxID=190893 RepID=A0AAP6ZPX9_9VIBR|nr:hypothetical protein [Vibrio coralliilyticus]NOI31814.1 hypothetical protein [Vibrio coralliilyticus]NOJ25257.1 hypothetical protein [Vibrio coralliilyticus]
MKSISGKEVKKLITQFYSGLYVGSIPLAIGLVSIALSRFEELSILSFVGVCLVALGVYQFKDLDKYGDQVPNQKD